MKQLAGRKNQGKSAALHISLGNVTVPYVRKGSSNYEDIPSEDRHFARFSTRYASTQESNKSTSHPTQKLSSTRRMSLKESSCCIVKAQIFSLLRSCHHAPI
jgi:hypothetical protein